MTAIYYSGDMMFSSRVASAAASAGIPLKIRTNTTVAPGDAAGAADCQLVLVDLGLTIADLAALIQQVRGQHPSARIVAHGAHVNEALLAAARAAGCDLVMSNGQFNREYAALLRSCGEIRAPRG